MAAQQGAFSTTLPLTELRCPIVPNKTNLIDPVYKNPCVTVKALLPGLFYLFIHCSFPHHRELSSTWSTRKLVLLQTLLEKKGRMQRRNSKVSKLDQWSQQSIKARVPQVSASAVSSKWTFKNSMCRVQSHVNHSRGKKKGFGKSKMLGTKKIRITNSIDFYFTLYYSCFMCLFWHTLDWVEWVMH